MAVVGIGITISSARDMGPTTIVMMIRVPSVVGPIRGGQIGIGYAFLLGTGFRIVRRLASGCQVFLNIFIPVPVVIFIIHVVPVGSRVSWVPISVIARHIGQRPQSRGTGSECERKQLENTGAAGPVKSWITSSRLRDASRFQRRGRCRRQRGYDPP